MGVPKGLETFLAANYPKVRGFLMLQVGRPEIAEELTQEAMAKAWVHWSKVRRMDRPDAWLFKVATNLALSYQRRKLLEHRRLSEGIGLNKEIVDASDSDSALSIRLALQQLPKKQRLALILRYYLDLPFEEVALVMDIPSSTARSHVRRALKRLQDSSLRKEFGDEPRYA